MKSFHLIQFNPIGFIFSSGFGGGGGVRGRRPFSGIRTPAEPKGTPLYYFEISLFGLRTLKFSKRSLRRQYYLFLRGKRAPEFSKKCLKTPFLVCLFSKIRTTSRKPLILVCWFHHKILVCKILENHRFLRRREKNLFRLKFTFSRYGFWFFAFDLAFDFLKRRQTPIEQQNGKVTKNVIDFSFLKVKFVFPISSEIKFFYWSTVL